MSPDRNPPLIPLFGQNVRHSSVPAKSCSAIARGGGQGWSPSRPDSAVTWTELRSRYRLGVDPYDPHDNISAGTVYIRELHDRYGAPGFLAAYSAGPGRYERHLATGRAPPHQTLAYVATLAPIIEGKQTDEKTVTVARSFVWTSSPLFAVRTASQSSRDRSSNGLHPDRSPCDRAAVDLSALVPHRTGCSRVMSAKFDRNDPDRASSQFVVGYRVF